MGDFFVLFAFFTVTKIVTAVTVKTVTFAVNLDTVFILAKLARAPVTEVQTIFVALRAVVLIGIPREAAFLGLRVVAVFLFD